MKSSFHLGRSNWYHVICYLAKARPTSPKFPPINAYLYSFLGTMSPSARILGSLEAAAPKISTARYVCVTCRRQSLPYRSQIVVHRARRYNSSDSQSWRDKLRSKFWRKDTPQESTSESQRDAEEEGQEEEAEPVATPLPNYVAANTWDGLRRVGFEKKWWEKEKTRDIEFEP